MWEESKVPAVSPPKSALESGVVASIVLWSDAEILAIVEESGSNACSHNSRSQAFENP
jgi:hypothetical protein